MKRGHVYTWWSVAALLSISIARSANPIYAVFIVLLSAVAVHIWAEDSAWRNSFGISLNIALFIIVFRLVASALIGIPIPGKTLFTLPTYTLPHWLAGVTLGGTISQERALHALSSSILLAAVVAIMGAAQSLTSPQRFLRNLPRFLYEFGLLIVIATSLIPQFFASVRRIREAHYLRGISTLGIKSFATPLIEEALERTLALSASMEVRGFGLPIRRTDFHSPLVPKERFGLLDIFLLCSACIAVIFI